MTLGLQMDDLAATLRESIATGDAELTSLQEMMKTQQRDHQSTVKLKTDAFSKAQTEMQRLLDEAVATGKENAAALQEKLSTQKREFEAKAEEKSDDFAKAQEELQTILEETEKKLEQVCRVYAV